METFSDYLVIVVSLITIAGCIVGVVSWIFRKILVDPLNTTMDNLAQSFDLMKESNNQAFGTMNNRVDDIENEVEKMKDIYSHKIELVEKSSSEQIKLIDDRVDKLNELAVINKQSIKSAHHRLDDINGVMRGDNS